MKIIEPSHEILFLPNADDIACRINLAVDNENIQKTDIFPSSINKDPSYMLNKEHNEILDYFIMVGKIVCDQDIGHQFAHYYSYFKKQAFNQISFSIDEPKDEITVIKPLDWEEDSKEYKEWEISVAQTEQSYFKLIEYGIPHHEASRVLPNCLKSETVMVCTLKEWRHILALTLHYSKNNQMHKVMKPFLNDIENLFNTPIKDTGEKGEQGIDIPFPI